MSNLFAACFIFWKHFNSWNERFFSLRLVFNCWCLVIYRNKKPNRKVSGVESAETQFGGPKLLPVQISGRLVRARPICSPNEKGMYSPNNFPLFSFQTALPYKFPVHPPHKKYRPAGGAWKIFSSWATGPFLAKRAPTDGGLLITHHPEVSERCCSRFIALIRG